MLRALELLREFADLIALAADCASPVAIEPELTKVGGAIAELRRVVLAHREEQRASRSFHDATIRFQEELVRSTIEREGWNLAATARALRLNRGHVYNLIRTFQLRRPKADESQ